MGLVTDSFKFSFIHSGEHYTEEYKKSNPLSKVPVIDDNGFILTER